MRHRLFVWLQAFAVCSMLMLTGCENGNLFGKLTDRGDSSDPQVLVSQGYDALRDGDYSAALILFNKALEKDPDNAEALYGASTAQLAGSGLNIGALISNLTHQTSSTLAVHDLPSLIRQSRVSVSATHTTANSILEGVDIDALNNVIDQVICRLQKIVSGATDGSIEKNNVDVLLNLASVCVIRGILRPIRNNYFDITNTNGSFDVTQLAGFNTACATDEGKAVVLQMAQDVVATWHLFNRAVTLLNLGNDQVISQLRADVATAIDKLFDDVDGGNSDDLPGACISHLQLNGITHETFSNSSNDSVFDPNSNNC